MDAIKTQSYNYYMSIGLCSEILAMALVATHHWFRQNKSVILSCHIWMPRKSAGNQNFVVLTLNRKVFFFTFISW